MITEYGPGEEYGTSQNTAAAPEEEITRTYVPAGLEVHHEEANYVSGEYWWYIDPNNGNARTWVSWDNSTWYNVQRRNELGIGYPSSSNPMVPRPPAPMWSKKFLTGEAMIFGGLFLGPALVKGLSLAAIAGEGKRKKTKNPQAELAVKAINGIADSLENSQKVVLPVVERFLTSPAVAISLIYANLEALHQQDLLDSSIAHTLEPVLIGSELISAIGKSGLVSQFAEFAW